MFSVDSCKLFHNSSYGDIRVVEAVADWVKTDGFNESSLIKDSPRKKESILSLRLHGAIEVGYLFKPIRTFRTPCFYFVCKRINLSGQPIFY
jgi:hypothetical protein